MTLGIQKGSPADAINRSQTKEEGVGSIRFKKLLGKRRGLLKETSKTSPMSD